MTNGHDVGDPPTWMEQTGQGMWVHLVSMLGDKLVEADRYGLTIACASYGAAEAALRDLNERGPLVPGRGKHGEEAPVKNPANQVAREQGAAFKSWCAEFGLTPAARKRLSMSLDKDEGDEGALID